MRLSGRKVIFVIACFVISFLLYTAYVVATVVVAGFTAIVAGFAQIGQVIAVLSAAFLFLCVLICFLLMSPIEFARMLLGFLPLLRALLQQ